LALLGASGVMAVTSAANTAIPVSLGALIDAVKRGLDEGRGRAAV